MRILIAPNAFKNSLPAKEVAAAIERGLMTGGVPLECECFPVADGGDGTGDLLIDKFHGEVVRTRVRDPLGRPIDSSFGIIKHDTAIIEMANASGIRLLNVHELDPLRASSFGTGQQIRAALDRGIRKVIVAVGGSATVDGGRGMLEALGVSFFDDRIDLSQMDPRLRETEITVLCDVRNKLLGPEGAATVFGPQKGADAAAVVWLETRLLEYATVIKRQLDVDINIERAGAAGGAAAGLYGILHAKLVDGIDYFLQLTEFHRALAKADIVITGEGSIDEQTLQGKAPFGVARLAKKEGKKVIALGGKIPPIPSSALLSYFDMIRCINPADTDFSTAIANTEINLTAAAKSMAKDLEQLISS